MNNVGSTRATKVTGAVIPLQSEPHDEPVYRRSQAQSSAQHHHHNNNNNNNNNNDDKAKTDTDDGRDPYDAAVRLNAGRRGQRRPSLKEKAAETAQVLDALIERALHYHELPHWRQDNPSIISGYRAESRSYMRSLRSVFELHNETVNIWSHLLAAIAFLAGLLYVALHGWEHEVLPRYVTASTADKIVFTCFIMGAVACLGMSAAFHCLTNHSEIVHKWGNKLDYLGIVIMIVSSYVPGLYYGFRCDLAMMWTYLSLIVPLGAACMVVSLHEHFRRPKFRTMRTSMFVGLGVLGVVPILHGLRLYEYGDMVQHVGLNWMLLEGALYLTGAGLYASRVPEAWWPGHFDIWGNSHQMFHCLVVAAAVCHLVAMIKAFDWHHGLMGGRCPV